MMEIARATWRQAGRSSGLYLVLGCTLLGVATSAMTGILDLGDVGERRAERIQATTWLGALACAVWLPAMKWHQVRSWGADRVWAASPIAPWRWGVNLWWGAWLFAAGLAVAGWLVAALVGDRSFIDPRTWRPLADLLLAASTMAALAVCVGCIASRSTTVLVAGAAALWAATPSIGPGDANPTLPGSETLLIILPPIRALSLSLASANPGEAGRPLGELAVLTACVTSSLLAAAAGLCRWRPH
jgi:hypothetical protein